MRLTMRRLWVLPLLAAGLAASSCGAHRVVNSATGSTAPSSAPSPTTSPSAPATTTSTVAADAASSLVGKTYQQLVQLGYAVHQRSDFGAHGSWTLFTVEHDGRWIAFTSSNQMGADGTGHLDDASQVLFAETLAPLPEGDWYGVQGVLRNGQTIGGVMMQGHGQEREKDGTYPVTAAWRVNLQTLKLEPTSTAGLDIMESCG